MLSAVRPVKGAREIIRRCKHLRGERQRPEIVDLDVKIGKDANVHGFALLSFKPVLSSGHRQRLIGPLALTFKLEKRCADEFGITVSYWSSEEAIAAWKAYLEHKPAQEAGKRVVMPTMRFEWLELSELMPSRQWLKLYFIRHKRISHDVGYEIGCSAA
jgi:hypothetical protein